MLVGVAGCHGGGLVAVRRVQVRRWVGYDLQATVDKPPLAAAANELHMANHGPLTSSCRGGRNPCSHSKGSSLAGQSAKGALEAHSFMEKQ